jgi:large subunit ribosomal protein L21
MYAVIRTGGKQYRVAPGDVVKIESVASDNKTIEFSDVLAVSGDEGSVAKPATAKVTAEVVREGRGDKILVFHLKRKKQYKKMQGHRYASRQLKRTASPTPQPSRRGKKIQKGIRQWHIKRVEAVPQTDAIPTHSGWA